MPDKTVAKRSATATRARLRRNARRLEEEIYEDLADIYEKPVEEWDWEELSHGRPRGENGKFQGGKPEWITPAIQAEARRRMRTLTEDELMVHAQAAMGVLVELMGDSDVDDFGKPLVPASVRADCAKYIINQVIGTPTAKVEVAGASKFESLMADILVNPDGEASHMVIEAAQAVDEDDDEDD
jgi:hypothetical protein